MILPSLKQTLVEKLLQEYIALRNTYIETPFKYNRKAALEFSNLGIPNNPDFIRNSTFGQLFQTCLNKNPDFAMMQNLRGIGCFSVEYDYDPSDIQEENKSAFIFRAIEKDLMSEMVPLLIKIPNGRLRCGLKRDCYKLNPKTTNPNYMKCYEFIGSLLGRILFRYKLFFGVPMAPTFWMLLNDEEPTLQDYAREDARLQKRLLKFN